MIVNHILSGCAERQFGVIEVTFITYLKINKYGSQDNVEFKVSKGGSVSSC